MENIIAAMIALITGLSIQPQYNAMVSNNLQATIDANAATQFQTMLTGANKYVGANLGAYAGMTVGSYAEVPFSEIAAAGDVPSGFSSTNVIGQTWHVYVIQPTSGVFQALVESEGGQQLSAKDLVKIAGEAGDLGGFVPYNGMLGDLSSADAVGANWSMSLSGLPSPGSGRLVGNISFGNTDSGTIDTNNFLYRVGVSGQPALNTMAVALNMGGNNINNAATVNAVQGAFSGGVSAASANVSGVLTTGSGHMGSMAVDNEISASSAVVSGQITAGSNVTVASAGCAFNAPGACFYGDGTNAAVRTDGALYVQNLSGGATDLNANHGLVKEVWLGTDNGTASINEQCSPNGGIAASASGTGQLLNCVNGVWKQVTGSGTLTGYETMYAITVDYDPIVKRELDPGLAADEASGGGILSVNPVTGTASCPSGTVDRQVFYSSGSFTSGYEGSESIYQYYYHLCTAS
jgi:Bacterial shufflon protein, N-terminal constant region